MATPNRKVVRKDGAFVLPLRFRARDAGGTAFNRADLVIEGVTHEADSYEVRIFLNNPGASAETSQSVSDGYAGNVFGHGPPPFSVFGHGGCYGGSAHCEIAGAPTATVSLAIAVTVPHPLTPKRKTVTITKPLKALLKNPDSNLETVTLVPIRKAPRREDCGPAADLFSYQRVRLQTYR